MKATSGKSMIHTGETPTTSDGKTVEGECDVGRVHELHKEDERSRSMIGTFPGENQTNQPTKPVHSMKVLGRIQRLQKGSIRRVWKVIVQGRNGCSSSRISYSSWGAGQLLRDSKQGTCQEQKVSR